MLCKFFLLTCKTCVINMSWYTFAIRAQSTRRTSMTFFQQASRCGMFSAGLLTRRPDANAFPAWGC